jgi:predicted nucleotidyltransferase
MTALTYKTIDKQITKIVKQIVKKFHPEKIILFGSYASGDANPDSDIDLLVVMSVEGLKREKAVEIGVALHNIKIPKDIIVTTPEEFEWKKDTCGTIEKPAFHQGRMLYARN